MRLILAMALVGLVFLAGYATAQSQFLTGQEFMGYPEAWRLTYAAGFHHGLGRGFIKSTGSVQERGTIGVVVRCAVQWTGGQAQAVLDRYLRDNPQRWHEWIGELTWSAFEDACRR